jgi:hypothetical protein
MAVWPFQYAEAIYHVMIRGNGRQLLRLRLARVAEATHLAARNLRRWKQKLARLEKSLRSEF